MPPSNMRAPGCWEALISIFHEAISRLPVPNKAELDVVWNVELTQGVLEMTLVWSPTAPAR
jgi:hypothetical protein